MSSLTIEVDDPEDAYENLRAMLEAAPVEFSQITSVRLELEYEPAADEDESATTADADEESGTPTATFTDPTAIASPEDDTPSPPIADAESADGATAEPTVDGADEITFRKPDADDDADDQTSVFGDPDETTGTDSVFSTPEDAVSFEDPDANAGQPDDAKTTDDGRPLGEAVDRSTAGGTAAEPDDGSASPPAQQRTVEPSPQTYNKVVRLLQNRDFPIERGEIEDVAVGAYEVDVDECRAVIDAAIDKGLVAQEGSKLVDPTA